MQPVIRFITCSGIAWEVFLPNSSDSMVACFPFPVWQGARPKAKGTWNKPRNTKGAAP